MQRSYLTGKGLTNLRPVLARLIRDEGDLKLAQAERQIGIAEKLAGVIADSRDPARILHLLPDILCGRILAIGCGYDDADDFDRLRTKAVWGMPNEYCGIKESAALPT